MAERLRCCHCGRFLKWENGIGLERTANKVGFKEVYSMWEMSDVYYFHLECDKKVKEYKKLIEIFE